MKRGDRMGCILSADADEVKLLGYGKYLGHQVPDGPVSGFLGELLHENDVPTPAIELDNGDVVYGCECWWTTEEKVKSIIGDRKITEVNIKDVREDCETDKGTI